MKKISKTLRLDERTIELIESQQGETFTEKFESLVIRFAFELPEKEKQLDHIKKQIQTEERQLNKLFRKVYEYQQLVTRLGCQLGELAKLIEAPVKDRSA